MVPYYFRSARLDLALLHYFSGNYDDAWIELGILLEEQGRFDTRQEQQEQQGQQEQQAACSRQQREEPSLSDQVEGVRVGHSLEDQGRYAQLLRTQATALSAEGPHVASTLFSESSEAAPPSPSSRAGRQEAAGEAAATQGVDVGAGDDAERGAEQDSSCGPGPAGSLGLAVDLGLSSEDPAWDPLTEDQVLQAKVLQEKLRLLLSV